MKILENFDLFKSPFELKVKNNYKISTPLGFLVSLSIFAILLYVFSQSDFIKKESPKVSIETHLSDENPEIFYDNNFFSISICSESGKNLYDPTLLNVSVINYFQKLNVDRTEYIADDTILKTTHRCTINDTNGDQKKFEKNLLYDAYCLDDGSFKVNGSFAEEKIAYVAIELSLCVNSTENNYSCQSFEKIEKTLKEYVYFNIFYVENIIQPSNYKDPFKKNFKFYETKIEPRATKISDIKLKKASLTTEDGVFFSNKHVQYFFESETQGSQLLLRESFNDTSNPVLVEYAFFSSNKEIVIERSYQSISETFAILGGLFNFFFIAFKTFIMFDQKLKLTKIILNEIYSFPNANELLLKDNKNQGFAKKMKETYLRQNEGIINTERFTINPIEKTENFARVDEKKISDSFVLSHFSKESEHLETMRTGKNEKIPSLSSPNIKQSINKSKNNKKKHDAFKRSNENNHQLSFNIFHYGKLLVKQILKMSLTAYEKLIVKSQEVFYQEIDVSNILKRIQDVEKLKYILLNKKQLVLFNFLGKTVVSIGDTKDDVPSYYKGKTDEKDAEEALKYYEELEKDHNKNKIDEAIYSLVDEKIKNFKNNNKK